MKLESTNENYAATVVKVTNTQSLNGLDRLVGLPSFGFQALIPKTTSQESLGLLFTAETQLSEDFCKANNLYRHKEKNADQNTTGYLEDTRRVRAIKFRGHTSSALWMPISSLDYLGIDTSQLSTGDSFTNIDGNEVCCKYRIRSERTPGAKHQHDKASRVNEKLFPKHFETANWFKNAHVIDPSETVYVTQKLHGTSVRFAHQLVARKLTVVERIAKWLGAKVTEQEFALLGGTRNTIRDPDVQAFYSHDIYTEWLGRVKHLIPKNWVVYGELIGFAGDAPIQKRYDYRHGPGQSSLYVYRVAIVNSDGVSVDLGWDVVKDWCNTVGLQYVPEIYRCTRGELTADPDRIGQCLDVSLNPKYGTTAVPLSNDSPCDEGVCIRSDRMRPIIHKAKSPVFREFETGMLDEGGVDMEETVEA